MTRHPLAALAALAITLILFPGCQSNDKAAGPAGADVCPHCPGVQVATADGKCPKCLMPVAAPGEADACPVCPGVQKATADGHCPECKAEVVDACPKCPGVQKATADGKCPLCGAKAQPTAKPLPTTVPAGRM